MKKTLLLSVLADMCLFSCKKDHSASTSLSAKKYKVTFNVTNFHTKSKRPSPSGTKPVTWLIPTMANPGDYPDVPYCVVYDTDGSFSVRTVIQDSTMANMGMITDSLPKGTYPVYFFAGKKGLTTTGIGYLITARWGYGGFNWIQHGAALPLGRTSV